MLNIFLQNNGLLAMASKFACHGNYIFSLQLNLNSIANTHFQINYFISHEHFSSKIKALVWR